MWVPHLFSVPKHGPESRTLLISPFNKELGLFQLATLQITIIKYLYIKTDNIQVTKLDNIHVPIWHSEVTLSLGTDVRSLSKNATDQPPGPC